MDTPSSRPNTSWPRWLRVGLVVSLILVVQGTLAYLLTWIDPASTPVLVPIRINSYAAWSTPKARHIEPGTTRAEIRQTLDDLANRDPKEPVIVYLSGIAMPDETGKIVIVPSDGTPADPAGLRVE